MISTGTAAVAYIQGIEQLRYSIEAIPLYFVGFPSAVVELYAS